MTRRGTNSSAFRAARVVMLSLFCAATGGYLTLIATGVIAPEDRLGTPELVLALAAVGVAFVGASPNYMLDSITLGNATFATATIRRIERRQEVLAEELRALQIALSGILTTHELRHLATIGGDGPAVVSYGSMGWKMVDELHRLDALGFIEPAPGHGIIDIKDSYENRTTEEFDLKRFVRITPEGREYLALQQRFRKA